LFLATKILMIASKFLIVLLRVISTHYYLLLHCESTVSYENFGRYVTRGHIRIGIICLCAWQQFLRPILHKSGPKAFGIPFVGNWPLNQLLGWSHVVGTCIWVLAAGSTLKQTQKKKD
jgi:hypothetical protein